MFERVLVAVDGSDCARRALEVGLAVAAPSGAAVDVVHVTESRDAADATDATGTGDVPDDERESDDRDEIDDRDEPDDRDEAGERVQSEQREDAVDGPRSVLEDVEPLVEGASADVELHAIAGTPADRIASFARERDADLVVVGRRGLAGIGERLLGSVTRAVLRACDRPVLTVPDGDPTSDVSSGDSSFDVSDVLVPTDGSEAAERAAPYGAALAAEHGGTVHVCYAVDLTRVGGPFSAGGLRPEVLERYERQGQEAADRQAECVRAAEPDVSVQTAVLRDMPHVAIRTSVQDHAIDVVVMSSSGQTTRVGQLLGSVTDRVLRTVDVPVLVVQP